MKKRVWIPIIIIVMVLIVLILFFIFYINKAELHFFVDSLELNYLEKMKQDYYDDEQGFIDKLQCEYDINYDESKRVYDNPDKYGLVNICCRVKNNSNRTIHDFHFTKAIGKDTYFEKEDVAHYCMRNINSYDYNDVVLSVIVKKESTLSDTIEKIKKIRFRAYNFNPLLGIIVSSCSDFNESPPVNFEKGYSIEQIEPSKLLQRFGPLMKKEKGDLEVTEEWICETVGSYDRIRFSNEGYYLLYTYKANDDLYFALVFFDLNDAYLCTELLQKKEDYEALPDFCRKQIEDIGVDVDLLRMK